MTRRSRFLLKALPAALLCIGAGTSSAAPFGVPFIPLPEGAKGNGGDTSAYFGLQLDPDTFEMVYPAPNVNGCAGSPAGYVPLPDGSDGGVCRTDFNNFDKRYKYDSVRWLTWDGGSTPLIDSLSWKDRDMAMFRKIYFGYDFDAHAPSNVVPAFSKAINYSLYSGFSVDSSSKTFALTTEAIFLDHVRLNLDRGLSDDNPLRLVFDGPNMAIHLSNASLSVGRGGLQVTGTSPFSINALQGINSIDQWASRTIISAPTAINISPGAWLSFSEFAAGLEFRGKGNTINAVGLNLGSDLDGGLELKRGLLRFDNGRAHFSQAAILHLVGSGTSATFDEMLFDKGARIAMDNGTSLTAHTVYLSGAVATLGDNATLLAQTMQVSQSNRINAGNLNDRLGKVQTNFLGIFDESQLELNSLAELRVKGTTQIGMGFAKPGKGAVINLNTSDVIAYDSVLMYNGSQLHLSDRATFTLRPDLGSHEHPDALLRGEMALGAAAGDPARINVGARSGLNVVYGGQIDISDQVLRVNIDATGALAVKGNLRGSGHIEGSGVVILEHEGTASGQKVSGGWLFPGTLGQPIGTLSTDPALYFEQGSQLRVNVGKDAQGQLTYGKVLYGAGDVTFNGNTTLALAQVPRQPPLTAADLDGKSITLLAARDATVTGTIQPSIYNPVVDVSAMPALLTWRVVDLQTNQHPDITLQADLLPVSGLQKGGGSKTNRGSGLGLMVTAAVQNPGGPIAGALNTVTNAQLGVTGTVSTDPPGSAPVPSQLPTPVQAQGSPVAQQNSWHPEPYSSYIATGLAHIANLRNMVFGRAAVTNVSGTQVWADTAGSRGSIDGQGDLGSHSYRMSHVVVGRDIGPLWGGAWGAYAGGSHQKIDEHDLQTQSISGTALGLGAYWRHQGSTWTTLAQGGVAFGQHVSTRQLTVGARQEALRAEYSSRSMQAAVRFVAPWWSYRGIDISHELGGSVSMYRQAGFDETGHADFGFRVRSASAASYIAHAGAQVRFPSLSLQQGLRPVGFVRLEHDFAGNKSHAIQASLLANRDLFAQFVGQGRGANSAVVGLGLTTETSGPWQIQAGLNHAWHTHGRDWGASLNIRYRW